eukprot:COSAG06_NODE_49146_length_327_cov_0.907895_1_plen_78_part_10
MSVRLHSTDKAQCHGARSRSGSKNTTASRCRTLIALVVAASQLLLLLLLLALSRLMLTPYCSNADIMMRSYWHDADVT